MNTLVKIIWAVLIIVILGMLVQQFTRTDVREGYLFCGPTDCNCVCQRNPYKKYCNSPYFKDGTASLCNCQWNDEQGLCLPK